MVDEVASVSQQTAAEATNVSAASEEQASSLSEASDNIQQLSRLADRLHDNVADFDVGDTGGRSARTGVSEQPQRTPDTGGARPDPDRPRTADRSGQPAGAGPTAAETDSDVDEIEPWTDISAAQADGGSERTTGEPENRDAIEPDQ